MSLSKRAGAWLDAWTAAAIASPLHVHPQTVPRVPGHPVPGLTPIALALFSAGRDVFLDEFVETDGLGPAFNGTSCAACHNVPAIGGTGVILETHAAYRDASGQSRGLNPAGDTLIHLFSV